MGILGLKMKKVLGFIKEFKMEVVMCGAMLILIYFGLCWLIPETHAHNCGGFRYEFFNYGEEFGQGFWENHNCLEDAVDIEDGVIIKPERTIRDS